MRSKLALTASRVAAANPSTSVIAAQTATTASRWLKTSRSSQLPDRVSKSAIVGGSESIVAATSGPIQLSYGCAARAHQYELSVAGIGEAGERCRTFDLHGGEGGAAVFAGADAS